MTKYSFIIPVYNRPEELTELLHSIARQDSNDYEVIVVDDGSSERSEDVVGKFQNIPATYYFKKNEGPGLTRNFGASKATGYWLIFLDSDCFLPDDYLVKLDEYLAKNSPHTFGGPDRAHTSFTSIQKAISFAMTSFLTTGGIRGRSRSLESFKPRSFNMGIKSEIFAALGGFSTLRFGEDIDLSLRILQSGYSTALIQDAYVFHKRRSTFTQFFKQIYNSGVARIVLDDLHPGTIKMVHYLPLAFVLGHFVLISGGFIFPRIWALLLVFPLSIFFESLVRFKHPTVAIQSILASYIQLFAYAFGFIDAWWQKNILRRSIIKYAYLRTLYD